MCPENQISLVIPVYNEEKSLPILVDRIINALGSFEPYEVIFVNDGSTDNTASILEKIYEQHPEKIKIIHLRTNSGKSIALQAGFNHVSAPLAVMLDADLQDSPEEIPKLIEHLYKNNYDVVTGWKQIRNDPKRKTIPSKFFNMILRRFSGLTIHDFNCGLKVFRKECLDNIKLYGQLHRYILILLAASGYKVGEIAVLHSARKHGKSKYGAMRLYEGLMDALTVLFITRFLYSPLHFFGFYGIFSIFISILFGSVFITLHIISLFGNFPQGNLAEHPIWILSPIMFLCGLIFIFFGIIGELINYQSASRPTSKYIEKKTGFNK